MFTGRPDPPERQQVIDLDMRDREDQARADKRQRDAGAITEGAVEETAIDHLFDQRCNQDHGRHQADDQQR